MKFMNNNYGTRYLDEADDGADLGGDSEESSDDTEENTDDKENVKLGDDNPDDIKLGDNDKDDKEGKQADDAPESYADFDMPEGIEVDQELLGKALPVFKELNLSQDQAQKLVDLQAQTAQETTEALSQQHVDTVNDWKTALHADKEIGGDNLNQSLADAKLFLKTHGDAETIKYLDESGLSNHPGLLKMFSKSGSLMREDNPGGNNANTKQTGSSEQNRANVLYSDD